jgi:hypothetical protein
MQRELTKEELEAQIEQKERRLSADLGTVGTELRERLGFHVKVTVPMSLAALTAVAAVVRQLARRKIRVDVMNQPGLVPLLAVVGAFRRLRPSTLIYGAVMLGAGALLERRRARHYTAMMQSMPMVMEPM